MPIAEELLPVLNVMGQPQPGMDGIRDLAVETTRYDGMIHGFVQMLAVTPRASEAIDQIATALRRAE